MAKKKKRNAPEKKPGIGHSSEVKGLILVLVVLIGVGNFGPVGRIVKNFAVFLFGNLWAILLLLLIVLGFYMILKRKNPNFLAPRLVGMYTLIIVGLILAHMAYVGENSLKGMDIIKTTIDNVMISVDKIENIRETGGGVIGSLFCALFVSLFDTTGTYIVTCVLLIFGIVMLFDVSIGDIIEFIKSKMAARKERKAEEKKLRLEEMEKEAEEDDEEEEVDSRVIINDINEITAKPITEPTIKAENIMPAEGENTPYRIPPLDLLPPSKNTKKSKTSEFVVANTKTIEKTLSDFGVSGKVVNINTGPTVTQYEVSLVSGTKVNKVLSIQKELSLALRNEIRVQAPIPGKDTIGIETPNPEASEVKIRDILEGVPKNKKDSKVLAALGKDIMGRVQFCEINKTPHMLVAGATGSGKSVCINNIIVSILMRATPDEVKLILVDPKKVELSMYEGIPHLLRPVVTNPKQANIVLKKVVQIMEDRYELFSETKTKNIATYNEHITKKHGKNTKDKLPYIVVVIDELADLMLVAAKEVEDSIMRITQMARAAGIHLIVATQRPSTDVITGVIKANIPSRISFAVSSSIDSRTILDAGGAEKLLGKGDMLYLPMGENTPTRIQGSFISDEEVLEVVKYCSSFGKTEYDESMLDLDNNNSSNSGGSVTSADDDDPLYNEIVEFTIKTGKVSASLLQRKYRLGYNRAARIIDLLEERGIIGPQNGSKPREVLVKLEKEETDE